MMKICPYCGKEISEKDKFCGWCGKKLPMELSEEEKETVKRIKERARAEDIRRKEIGEREKERKTIKIIREKAKKETEEIGKAKSRKEQIIERLTKVPSEEKEKRGKFLRMLGVKKPKKEEDKIPAGPKIREEKVIFRPVPQARISPFEKIWVRAIILILILAMTAAILIFGFDVLNLKQKPVIVTPSLPAETPKEPEEKPETLIVPPSLLSVEKTSVLEISSLDELPTSLSNLISSGRLPEKVFTRIVIKNLEENKTVDLKEFLGGIGAETPELFYQKLKLDFTLFTFAPQTNQIGFIAEIKENQEEGLKNLLTVWEKEMKADLEPLFSLLGKEKLMAAYSFKDKIYLGEDFRYFTFWQENFGICYGSVKDYFIFTTSEESILKLIEYKVGLTKDLKLGDRGAEVEILQTWLAGDIKIYPEGFVTGYFGPLTQRAVVRFQQKYSEDILKPWGLVEGTGKVDESTRKKLNEVYKR